jgi:hypothetical protein
MKNISEDSQEYDKRFNYTNFILEKSLLPKIKTIDENGLVIIEFSKAMIDEKDGFNISYVNNESMSLKIQPSYSSR